MDEKKTSAFGLKWRERPQYWPKQLPYNQSLAFMLLFLFIFILLFFFFSTKKTPPAPPKLISVVTSKAISNDVPIYRSALGTVTPLSTVTIRTQLNGLLMSVLFQEGQLVKKGQLLAQIDQRPYQALLTQYEGDLKRDTALLANAKIDLKRYQTLWKQNSISQQTLATQQSLVEQYEGAVQIDLGQIQSTKVNIIYCNITSPVDGRIGLRLVDAGNFVQISDTQGIAVITTHNPITVIFPLAEDYVQEVLSKAYSNEPLEVKAYNRQQTRLLDTGKLLALDSQISTTTGTVKLRAIFDNKQFTLFPNQFVNVSLLVDTLKKATLVPTAAIQHTTNTDFVYLLKANNTVATTNVTIGPLSGEYTVITKGLKPGQAIIVSGADKLVNGAKVKVQNPKTKNNSSSTGLA